MTGPTRMGAALLSAAAGFGLGHALGLIGQPPQLWYQPLTGALAFGWTPPDAGPWMGFYGTIANALVCAALCAVVVPAGRSPRRVGVVVLAASAMTLLALLVAG
jgi:hypothetical protein